MIAVIDPLLALLDMDLISSLCIIFVIHLLLLLHLCHQPAVSPHNPPTNLFLFGWIGLTPRPRNRGRSHSDCSVLPLKPPLTLTFAAHHAGIIRSIVHLIDSSYWCCGVNRSVHLSAFTTQTEEALQIN